MKEKLRSGSVYEEKQLMTLCQNWKKKVNRAFSAFSIFAYDSGKLNPTHDLNDIQCRVLKF